MNKYLQFLQYVETLPQRVQFAIRFYIKTGKQYGSICIDVDYIPKLQGIEKTLATYNIKAKFKRINPHVEQDERGGKDYTHYSLNLGEL